MRKIAVTGNIAAGKSAVENILRAKGFKVIDADVIAHELLVNNHKVTEAFKEFDIFEDNGISRKKLGTLVFENHDLRKRLEDILHPEIKDKIYEFFLNNRYEKYVFASVPLLFEAGMQGLFDEIVFVYADDDIRLARLMERNGFSREEALLRMNSQMPQQDKIEKSDFIIENNGSIDELKKQIDALF